MYYRKFYFYIEIEMPIWFVNHWNPWFIRGEHFSTGLYAGAFALGNDDGSGWSGESFRVVCFILWYKSFKIKCLIY